MLSSGSVFLLVSASLSLAAAVLHFACIPWGANGYRILGAGEPIVTWAAQGHWYPPLVAFYRLYSFRLGKLRAVCCWLFASLAILKARAGFHYGNLHSASRCFSSA